VGVFLGSLPVANIVTFPPQQESYIKLKTELLNRPFEREHIRQLLTCEEKDDHKPSQILIHLRSLDSDVPDRLLRIM
jgi:hypothetical protein